MTEHADEQDAAIARFIEGTSDRAESARVAAWLANDPALASLVQHIADTRTPSADLDIEAAFALVRARIGSDEPHDIVSFGAAREQSDAAAANTRVSRAFLAVAATLAIVVGGLAVWTLYSRTGAPLTYATTTGETRRVTLVDGTMVDLAPATTMKVARGYMKHRTVEMEGLARFTVVHDPTHPFRVKAGDATVEDIGTVFSVRTEDHGIVAVAVTEGTVSLRSSGPTGTARVVLNRGDIGTARGSHAEFRSGAVTASDSSWTSGRLSFDNAPLERVQADLRRWYGVDVVIGDSSIASRHLTATFDHDSLDQVLRVLGLALDAQVYRRRDTVFIRPR
jgi:transmembrane sensor